MQFLLQLTLEGEKRKKTLEKMHLYQYTQFPKPNPVVVGRSLSR